MFKLLSVDVRITGALRVVMAGVGLVTFPSTAQAVLQALKGARGVVASVLWFVHVVG